MKLLSFLLLLGAFVVNTCNAQGYLREGGDGGSTRSEEASSRRLQSDPRTVTVKDPSYQPVTEQKIRRVFVNFAFAHTEDDRLDNLKFFLKHGVQTPHPDSGLTVHYGLVVNGECHDSACSTAPEGVPFRIITRGNIGFDFGQHTAMLEELDKNNETYDAYVFLNAGVTGPFVPSFMPAEWHWTRAFTDKLVDNVGAVATSIVCLPSTNEGGFGPKVEGFAFAMSAHSLKVVRKYGTSFRQHKNKRLAIVDGEYALTKTLFQHGMTIDSLLLAYKGVKWNPNMACNGQRHTSRHGHYFGMQMHPLETIFHKESWHGNKPVLGETFPIYKSFVNKEHLPITIAREDNELLL